MIFSTAQQNNNNIMDKVKNTYSFIMLKKTIYHKETFEIFTL